MTQDTPTPTELLPCPFCGGKARLEIGKAAFEDAEIGCAGCATTGPNCDDGFGREDNSRLAITAWNTRLAHTDAAEVALAWFGSKPRLELYHYGPTYCDDNDQSYEWRIDERRGPINDVERNIVGRGATPLEAIQSARTALGGNNDQAG